MRVTVCELPHEPETLAAAWTALCEHTVRHSSELVLLPEERSQIFHVLAPTPRVLAVPNARSTKVHAAKRLRITIDRRQPRRFALTEDERGVELAGSATFAVSDEDRAIAVALRADFSADRGRDAFRAIVQLSRQTADIQRRDPRRSNL